MDVFVSWSGLRSRALAHALRALLPDVIQNLEVWMSEHDLQAGVRWSSELSSRLSKCQLGIACVTSDNQTAPWLLFEAGAISKSLDESRLVPLLLDLEPAQVTHPLAQFQLVTAERAGIYKLMETLNSLSASPLSADRLAKQLGRIWPELQLAIEQAKNLGVSGPAPQQRSDREVLYEILDRIRALPEATTAVASNQEVILVDTRPFLGGAGEVVEFSTGPGTTVSDFLDEVWRALQRDKDVPVYSYNTVWVLFSHRLQAFLPHVGSDYIRSGGKRRDKTTLDQAGIWPRDRLEVREPRRAKT